jgi:hypothetical protein
LPELRLSVNSQLSNNTLDHQHWQPSALTNRQPSTLTIINGAIISSPPVTMPTSVLRCTIESLPAELRLQILSSISDLEDLKAAVLSSPVLHAQYLFDRQRILRRVIKATLGNAIVDAVILHKTMEHHKRHQVLNYHKPRSLLWEHHELRRTDPDRVLEECKLEDLTAIASYYLGTARHRLAEASVLVGSLFDPIIRAPRWSSVTQTTDAAALLTMITRGELLAIVYRNAFRAMLVSHAQHGIDRILLSIDYAITFPSPDDTRLDFVALLFAGAARKLDRSSADLWESGSYL